MTTFTKPRPAVPMFEDEAMSVLSRVRKAFAGLLDAVASPGTTPRATDLQKKLDIPSTLAWRIHRVARAQSPLSEVESIPGVAAVQRVAVAAQKKALPEDLLDEVINAIEGFEALVRDHADSRQTFNAMVASIGGATQDVIDLPCRKAAFQINSQVWGIQARTLLWSGIYHPGSHDLVMHNGLIMGALDVKRLHTDVKPNELRLSVGEWDGKRFGPVLLEDFSTQPLPVVNRTRLENGMERLELLPPTIGNNGATTFFVAEGGFDLDFPEDDPENRRAIPNAGCFTPAETLIVDVLIYDDMFGEISPSAAVFDARTGRVPDDELLTRRRLPVKVDAAHLGRGLDAMHSADLPRYPAMVEDVCGRLGWDASKFDVYRCRVEYPIMSSITAMWFPLPEKGNW